MFMYYALIKLYVSKYTLFLSHLGIYPSTVLRTQYCILIIKSNSLLYVAEFAEVCNLLFYSQTSQQWPHKSVHFREVSIMGK